MKNPNPQKMVIIKGSFSFICNHKNFGGLLEGKLIEISQNELTKKMKTLPAVKFTVENVMVESK